MCKSDGMNIAFAKAGTEELRPERAEDAHAVQRRTIHIKPTIESCADSHEEERQGLITFARCNCCFGLAGCFGLRRCGSWLEDPNVQRSAHRATDERCYPKQPKLCERPPSNKDGWPRAPCRVHREIRNRYSDQMNQRQSQSDRDRRKARRSAPVRCAHNDYQEKASQHHFSDKA